jgi:hypothetical protein
LKPACPGAAKAARERENGENFDKAKLDDVAELIQRYEKLSEMAYILQCRCQHAGFTIRHSSANGARSATV